MILRTLSSSTFSRLSSSSHHLHRVFTPFARASQSSTCRLCNACDTSAGRCTRGCRSAFDVLLSPERGLPPFNSFRSLLDRQPPLSFRQFDGIGPRLDSFCHFMLGCFANPACGSRFLLTFHSPLIYRLPLAAAVHYRPLATSCSAHFASGHLTTRRFNTATAYIHIAHFRLRLSARAPASFRSLRSTPGWPSGKCPASPPRT